MRANDGTGQSGHVTPKHAWVTAADGGGPAPGILLDWRVTSAGRWEAYVVWADGGGAEQPRAHLEWLDQDRVKPWE